MAKNQKSKAHQKKMEQKRLDKVYTQAVENTCRFCLLTMYASLVDQFGWDMEQLSKLRKKMDRISVFIKDCDITGLTQEEIVRLLAEKGIDVSKIGDI